MVIMKNDELVGAAMQAAKAPAKRTKTSHLPISEAESGLLRTVPFLPFMGKPVELRQIAI